MMNKNKQFLSPKNRLGAEITEAYHFLSKKAVLFFSEFDVTPQQYNVLAILAATGPISTATILDWMIEKNAGVSRLVDRLVKKGLVVKNAHEADKRLVSVSLTPKGNDLNGRIGKEIHRMDDFVSNLSAEEIDTLISLLDKMNTVSE